MAGQHSLCCVSQCFSRAVKYSRIGWDEAMMLRDLGSYGDTGCAGRDCQPSSDKFASRDIVHTFTPPVG